MDCLQDSDLIPYRCQAAFKQLQDLTTAALVAEINLNRAIEGLSKTAMEGNREAETLLLSFRIVHNYLEQLFHIANYDYYQDIPPDTERT